MNEQIEELLSRIRRKMEDLEAGAHCLDAGDERTVRQKWLIHLACNAREDLNKLEAEIDGSATRLAANETG